MIDDLLLNKLLVQMQSIDLSLARIADAIELANDLETKFQAWEALCRKEDLDAESKEREVFHD